MTTYQKTGPENSTTIRWGSADIYLGDDEASATSVGILEGDVTIEIQETPRRYQPANAPERTDGMASQIAIVSFNLYEQNLYNLENIRNGLDYFSSTDGTPVAVVKESHVYAATKPVFVNYYNTAGTVVSSITVYDSSDNVISASTNYVTGVDSRGYSYVLPLSGGSISDTDTIKISYTYTPASAFLWGTGGKSVINSRYMKLVNTNEDGEDLKFEFWSATHEGGLTFTLGQDTAESPNTIPIKMRCTFDATKAAGLQLLKITDEQGVTNQV